MLKEPNLINKEIVYCLELRFGILKCNSNAGIEKTCIISSDVEINKYKLLCINTLSLSYFLIKLGISHYLGFFEDLTEIGSDFIDIS